MHLTPHVSRRREKVSRDAWTDAREEGTGDRAFSTSFTAYTPTSRHCAFLAASDIVDFDSITFNVFVCV